MAGAGYKLFNTGDVLTAAQVNTYLQEQTVMVFADAAARTTALSGVLAEGMASYLKDTDSFEVYNGSAWVSASGDLTALTAGTGISISSATGPVPTVTNSMATEITASGDIIVGTGSGTFDNLPIGTTGQVLTADTTVSPYKVKWASASSATNYSLINSGGTALTGAATITISGISGKNRLFCLIFNASSASGNSNFYVRLNSDTGSNYGYFNPLVIAPDSVTHDSDDVSDKCYVGAISANAASTLAGFISVDGCNSAGIKTIEHATGSTNATGGNAQLNVGGGYWSGTGTVTSISITSDTGNFDNGTIWVYGA
jgi:hypothetical protein